MPPHHIRSYLRGMSETHTPTDSRHETGRYEIRLQGHLDTRWAAWFDGLTLTRGSDGTTVKLNAFACRRRRAADPLRRQS